MLFLSVFWTRDLNTLKLIQVSEHAERLATDHELER